MSSDQLMTDVERAVVENLKLYPEMILDIKKETVALCNRCNGVIPLGSDCLDNRWLRGREIQPLIDELLETSCPTCGSTPLIRLPGGEKPTSFASFRRDTTSGEYEIHSLPVPHRKVQITSYLVERKVERSGLFGLSRRTKERWVEERALI